MNDVSPDDQRALVLEALYQAATRAPALELVLNSIPDIDGDRATVTSISLVLGGDLREPQILRCQQVIDSLQRDDEGRWHVDARGVVGQTDGRPSGAAPA